MLFSSIPFLYYFLACVLLLYFIVPYKIKNLVLLLSSLFFYAWGEVRYVVLMILAIIMGYVFGLLIAKSSTVKQKKVFLILAVVSSVGMLGYFKYLCNEQVRHERNHICLLLHTALILR